MSRRSTLGLLPLGALLALAACGDADPKPAAVAPDLTGKADAADHVALRGTLAWEDDAAASGAFTEDLAFDAWTLEVRAGARLTLDIPHAGSSSKLDTTLYVYGPRDAAGAYGATALAFDDDSGWGRLSRLRDLELAAGGTYLVVVGTADGRGRGSYRLVARCADDACGPVATADACPTPIRDALLACADDLAWSGELGPGAAGPAELVAACAEAEVVAPAFDALCASADASAELCAGGIAAFAATTLPGCAAEATTARLDAACVFGARYGELWDQPGATVVLWQRTLIGPDGLSALESEQIVRAVRETAYDDVASVDEAFDAVDAGEVHQTALWDASARRAFVAYEVGAGDNSFGAFFAAGTLDVVARITDGDLTDCVATWGPERRPCAADADCADGLRCAGRSAELDRGRCLDPRVTEDTASGSACEGVAGCPADAGLVCAGAAYGGSGLCQPAWMRGRFVAAPEVAIPDANAAGADVAIPAYGLATVDVEVTMDLFISHPNIAELRVSLVNPMGTEVPVFSGERSGGELYVRDLPVRGFSGDEAVNGLWHVRVVDTTSGKVGTLHDLALTVTSRWD